MTSSGVIGGGVTSDGGCGVTSGAVEALNLFPERGESESLELRQSIGCVNLYLGLHFFVAAVPQLLQYKWLCCIKTQLCGSAAKQNHEIDIL